MARSRSSSSSLLRARGGISAPPRNTLRTKISSPRTRRYFRRVRVDDCEEQLFSAHAEVFPFHSFAPPIANTLLRARGGISIDHHLTAWRICSSPRTRRYFLLNRSARFANVLFSAHAEVFPIAVDGSDLSFALLRARGGISGEGAHPSRQRLSSPRTRRYFLADLVDGQQGQLFSAHAEVFPHRAKNPAFQASLLRARGGISTLERLSDNAIPSSPRTRRYFPVTLTPESYPRLFSAHAEVFPRLSI